MTPERRAEGTVAATVTTFNRKDRLRVCLDGVLAQTRPVDEVIVVDNGSSDGTVEMLAVEFPQVRVLQMGENTGAAGGFAAGMREGVARGHAWVWVFNDDDTPVPTALATMLDALSGLPETTGVLACARRLDGTKVHPLGAVWRRRQLPLSVPPGTSGPVPLDVVAFSGSLVSAELIRDIGLPRAEYFMMVEELEFCVRARDAGWRTFVVPDVLTTALTLGSVGSSPPWRGYYQTRNQLAMALGRRSPAEVFWWAVRTTKLCAGAVYAGDDRLRRVQLRALGAWHALRGVHGLTIDPSDWAAAPTPKEMLDDHSPGVSTAQARAEEIATSPAVGVPTDAVGTPRLFGVLVTYRRPDDLARTLALLDRQTLPLTHLVVVDNGPDAEGVDVTSKFASTAGTAVTAVVTGANLGPAGGLAAGLERIQQIAGDDDWVVFLDDDNPPDDADALRAMSTLAQRCATTHPETAAVGLVGARLDRRRGRLVRPSDDELTGLVAVDYIGGGQLPLYRVGALRRAGYPRPDLFFGFDDLELGMRLRAAGFELWVDGERWQALRARYGRLGPAPEPFRGTLRGQWRQYYAIRNLIVVLRLHAGTLPAIRSTAESLLVRPFIAARLRPRPSLELFQLHARACIDAWTWRMGRRVEPEGDTRPRLQAAGTGKEAVWSTPSM